MRSIWRGVKNQFYNYDEGECLIRDATSKDDGHPTPEELRAICRMLERPATVDSTLNMLAGRLMDLNHIEHVHKSLQVIEYLLHFADNYVVRRLKFKVALDVSRLRRYQYSIGSHDYGSPVRKKARVLYEYLTDNEQLRQFRGEVSDHEDETPLPHPPPRRQKSEARMPKKHKKKKSKRRLKIDEGEKTVPIQVAKPVRIPPQGGPPTPPLIPQRVEQPEDEQAGWGFIAEPSAKENQPPLDLLTGPNEDWVNDFLCPSNSHDLWHEEEEKMEEVQQADLLGSIPDPDPGWVEGSTVSCSMCGYDNSANNRQCSLCNNLLIAERQKNTDLSVSNLFSASARALLKDGRQQNGARVAA